MYSDLLGKQFEYHGRGPDKYDCVGLAIEVFKRNGITLPDFQSTSNCIKIHDSILSFSDRYEFVSGPDNLVAGLFQIVPKFITHIGVFLDKYGRFIHILDGTNVTIENVNSLIWKSKIKGYIKWKL